MAMSPRVITLTKTNRAGVVVATAYAITVHDLANLDGDRGGYLVGDFTDDAARSRISPPSTPDSLVFIARDVHGEFLEASGGEHDYYESLLNSARRRIIAWEAGMPDTIGSEHCNRLFSRCAYTEKVNR